VSIARTLLRRLSVREARQGSGNVSPAAPRAGSPGADSGASSGRGQSGPVPGTTRTLRAVAYVLASERRHFLQSQGIRAGSPEPRGQWVPDGTIHALHAGASQTVCSVSVTDVFVFPDLTWPVSYYGGDQCTDCAALLEDGDE
jgi:hypothetical protein